jgi:hypothetical protein
MKTKPTTSSVDAFVDSVPDEARRRDCRTLLELMREITGSEPAMWGSSMVGFGRYHYRYDSGREGDWFLTGFSPRKSALTVYVMAGFDRYEEIMRRLGKHKTGKSCLYLVSLADVDLDALRELVEESVRHVRHVYPATGGRLQALPRTSIFGCSLLFSRA